jgi:hypothetical protein
VREREREYEKCEYERERWRDNMRSEYMKERDGEREYEKFVCKCVREKDNIISERDTLYDKCVCVYERKRIL